MRTATPTASCASRWRGRISWVRRVAEDGEVRILDHRLRLRRAASEYIVATLATGRDELVVRLDGHVIASYRHSIGEKASDRSSAAKGERRWERCLGGPELVFDGNDLMAGTS